jgi:hypothetical protein
MNVAMDDAIVRRSLHDELVERLQRLIIEGDPGDALGHLHSPKHVDAGVHQPRPVAAALVVGVDEQGTDLAHR